MKNNKYQITGIKGRFLRLGFAACCLLIVFLCACEDGFEPTVQLNVDKDELSVETDKSTELKVTLIKSSRIETIYSITWSSDPENVATIQVKDTDGEVEIITTATLPTAVVLSTAVITFSVKGIVPGNTIITIEVSKPNEDPTSQDPMVTVDKKEVAVAVTHAAS